MKQVAYVELKGKKKDVLDAALKLTVDHSLANTSIAEIAKEANVGMGTIYRYFKNKEDLFSSIFSMLRERLVVLIVSNYNPSINQYENFIFIVSKMIKYYIANPYEFKYLERYSDSNVDTEQRLDEVTVLLEPVMQMFNTKGLEFKHKPFQFDILFAMIYGPLIAIVNLVHMKGLILDDEEITRIAQSCWDSILEK